MLMTGMYYQFVYSISGLRYEPLFMLTFDLQATCLRGLTPCSHQYIVLYIDNYLGTPKQVRYFVTSTSVRYESHLTTKTQGQQLLIFVSLLIPIFLHVIPMTPSWYPNDTGINLYKTLGGATKISNLGAGVAITVEIIGVFQLMRGMHPAAPLKVYTYA